MIELEVLISPCFLFFFKRRIGYSHWLRTNPDGWMNLTSTQSHNPLASWYSNRQDRATEGDVGGESGLEEGQINRQKGGGSWEGGGVPYIEEGQDVPYCTLLGYIDGRYVVERLNSKSTHQYSPPPNLKVLVCSNHRTRQGCKTSL